MGKDIVRFLVSRSDPGAYEARRDGVLLGHVRDVEEVEVKRYGPTARIIRKVRRWQFRPAGTAAWRMKYATRKAAGAGLASWFDARAKAEAAREGGE